MGVWIFGTTTLFVMQGTYYKWLSDPTKNCGPYVGSTNWQAPMEVTIKGNSFLNEMAWVLRLYPFIAIFAILVMTKSRFAVNE